jgi:tetratricopeptide (TPR) repeat protein
MRGAPLLALFALVTWPGSARAHAGLAEALARLDQALAEAPSARLWMARAERQLQDGLWTEALGDLARARGLPLDGGGRARWEGLHALALEGAGRPAEALAAVDAALASLPAASLHRARARLLGARGQWAEALVDLRAAQQLDASPEGCLQWAEAAERAGRPAEAERVLESGLSQLGGSVPVRLALVDLLQRTGRPARALEWVKRAEEAWPQSPEWPVLAAELHRARGTCAQARDALARAERLLARRAARGRGGELDAPWRGRAAVARAGLERPGGCP